MKKIAGIITTVILTISMIVGCEQDNSINVIEKDYQEILEVNGTAYELFVEDYKNFIDGLDAGKKGVLMDYIENSLTRPTTQKLSVNCNCQPDDRECSATGSMSECCICCTPPQSAACGVYFGIASCQCSGGNPIPRLQYSAPPVTIYPKKIAQLISYAKINGINTIEISRSFEALFNSIK